MYFIPKTVLYFVVKHYQDNTFFTESAFYLEEAAQDRVKYIEETETDPSFLYADYTEQPIY